MTDNLETAWQPPATKNTLNANKPVNTGEQAKTAVTPPKQATKPRPLTIKQKLFVKGILDNPKRSATAIVKEVYNVTSQHSAEVIASENLSKPEIVNQLERNSSIFESVVVNTAKDWGNSDKPRERELALQASYWGHDKVHGKATQRVEQTTTGITLNIDLTGTGTPQE